MAIEIKFTCAYSDTDYLETSNDEGNVLIKGYCDNIYIEYHFDIPTAIKLSKSIRTEINKAKGI